MKEWIKKNKINILIMAIYSICSYIILIFHEPWRDEAQQWLIVRDLDFFGVLQQMKYEGHFLLWYLILMPFAKMGLPYEYISIISWGIVNIAVWLIIQKSPFKWWIRLLLAFSAPLLYFYPAITRSYCLIPLAIVLIAMAYKNRKTKPITYILSILLLANTHVIMLGLVGMLLLTFYIEQIKNRKQNTKKQNQKIILSLFLAIILLTITMFPLMESLNSNKNIRSDYHLSIDRFQNLWRNLVRVIQVILNSESEILVTITIILGYICLIYEGINYPKNFVIIFISILYQLIIYEFIYVTSYQRANTILMILLLFAWIQKEDKKRKNINEKEYAFISKILTILLVLNCAAGIESVINELKFPYSSAKQTAQFIKENIKRDSIMISNNMPYSSSIIPYVKDLKIWNPEKEDYFTYVTWDEDVNKAYYTDFMEKVRKNFDSNQELYYIYDAYNQIEKEKIQNLEEEGTITKIFESDESIEGENFVIYRIHFKNKEEPI